MTRLTLMTILVASFGAACTGFQRVAVLEQYVKIVDHGYVDIAILVKELASAP